MYQISLVLTEIWLNYKSYGDLLNIIELQFALYSKIIQIDEGN